ncbi:DUF6470 family protein [Oscillospiraceae bacterium MB08-C2-2]|nr:DUF6470 family protein [Oscillospiraceae bacterium MB08-C2-2]
MKPLLKISTVPIEIQMQTKRASLQYNTELPSATVTRQRGGLEMQSSPAQIRMDSYEMRASIGLKSVRRSISESASAGRTAAMEASRRYAEEGNQMLDSYGKGQPLADIAMSRVMNTAETIMSFSPSASTQFEYVPHSLEMQYTPDVLNYDWHIQQRPQMEYVPGKVEVTVTQYPSVNIEFIGEPVYAPPSANPNYQHHSALDIRG